MGCPPVARFTALVCALAPAGRAIAEALPCEQDTRLSRAAATLLLERAPLRSSELLRAARRHGFDGVSVHASATESDERLRSFLAELRRDAEGRLTCGEARSEGRRLVLASVRGGSLWKAGARVHGALEPGFGAPLLVLERADGALSSLPVTPEELARGVALEGEPAATRVQLSADAASGPRPLAELRLEPQASAPTAVEAPPPETPPEAAIEALRRAAGAPPLRGNRLLARSAARHAERVCEAGRLVHRLDGEGPEQRLAREHIGARGVGEALARAESLPLALRAMAESPSHRLVIARRDFTDVGIGEARDERGRVCLVVLLAAWPRRLP